MVSPRWGDPWRHSWGNDFELIPTVQVESQHSVGAPTSRDFPRFVIISQISRTEVGSHWRCSRKSWPFWEKDPKFSKMFSERIHHFSDPRLVCKFREIWLTGNRWSRALFMWQKTKLPLALPLSLLRRSRPKSVTASSRHSKYPKFHPNPFTSGRVIAGHVSIVETRHKVFRRVKIQSTVIIIIISQPEYVTACDLQQSHISLTRVKL